MYRLPGPVVVHFEHLFHTHRIQWGSTQLHRIVLCWFHLQIILPSILHFFACRTCSHCSLQAHVHVCKELWHSVLVKKLKIIQRAKSRRFYGEYPGIVVVGRGNPRRSLGCKWNENPHGNSGEIFKSGLKWEGSFPKPVNILIHQRITSNHHWDIFT